MGPLVDSISLRRPSPPRLVTSLESCTEAMTKVVSVDHIVGDVETPIHTEVYFPTLCSSWPGVVKMTSAYESLWDYLLFMTIETNMGLHTSRTGSPTVYCYQKVRRLCWSIRFKVFSNVCTINPLTLCSRWVWFWEWFLWVEWYKQDK
jgi:hypothetical protein